MPLALEKFYGRKKTGAIPDEILQENLAQEVLGRQILKKHSPGFFVKLLDILDRPGNATRALLVGKLGGLKGLIPFAQVIEDLTGINIALDPDERVRGTEVIEKFFGKQKQVKGKIDMVDALGIIVEIVADPLWLLGGAGLTKLGKARKLVGSNIEGLIEAGIRAGNAAGGLDDAAKVVKAVHAARAGKVLTGDMPKQLARAIRTVAAHKGPVRLRSLSWAKQVARGERASLSILGRPVIKGQKLTALLEKQVNKLRTGVIGEGFLSAPRRTTIEHGRVARIFTKARGEEIAAAGKRTSELASIKDVFLGRLVKRTGLSVDEVGELAARHVEIKGGLKQLSEDYAKAQKALSPEMDTLLAKIKRLESMKDDIERTIATGKRADVVEQGGLKVFHGAHPENAKNIIEKGVRTGNIKGNEFGNRTAFSVSRSADFASQHGDEVLEFTIKPNAKIATPQNMPEGIGDGVFRIAEQEKAVKLAKDKGFDAIDIEAFFKESTGRVDLEQELQIINTNVLQPTTPPLSKLPLSRTPAQNKNLADFEKITGVSKMTDDMLKAEIDMGLEIHPLTRGIGYAPRRITVAMEKDIKARRLRPFKRFDAAQGSVAAGTQRGRVQAFADKLRGEVVAEQKAAGFVEDVFDPDFLKGVEGRSKQHAETMAAARSIKETIRKFGKPVKEGVVEPGFMSGKQITHPVHGNPAMTGLIADDIQLPRDIARAIGGAFEVADDPRIAAGYWRLHEQGTKFLKGAFTVPFPAFHARNTITNKIQNWLEGAFNPRAYADAFSLQVAAKRTRGVMRKALKEGQVIDFQTAARQVDWPTVKIGGKETPGLQLFDAADQRGILGRTIGDVSPEELLGTSALDTQVKGLRRIAKGQDPIMKTGRFVGGTIEDHDKLAHFLDKVKQGFSPDDAAISAKKALFDYNDLSQFEKKWLRDRFVFFYTFARKNLGLQAKHLAQSPGKQAAFAHLTGGTPTALGEARNFPNYFNERLIGRTPFRDKQGNPIVIPGLGTPLEEAFGPLGGPGVGPVQRTRRILSRGLSRANPIVLKPIEFATGQNIFFDKPITNFREFGLNVLPTARLTSTVKRLIKSPEPLTSKISGVTTGLRFRPLKPLEQQKFHRRNVAKAFLQGRTPEFRRFFKPKGTTVDPKIDLALQMQR